MSAAVRIKVGLPTHTFPANTPLHCLIMVSGAGGGLHGPADLYNDLRHHLTRSTDHRIVTVAMDYRNPAHMTDSLHDVHSTLAQIRSQYDVSDVVLMGWSFGGGVVVGAAATDTLTTTRSPHSHGSIAALITLGTQTAGTDGMERLHRAELSCLFFHGGSDTCLPVRCSQQLYARYAGGDKELVVYEGDDHGCSQNKQNVIAKVEAFLHRVFAKRGYEYEEEEKQQPHQQ